MTLPQDLEQALRRAAAVPRLLACWDFDGTLAPIVDDPQAARPLPGAMSALSGLAESAGTCVALLSGRARDDLARLSGAGDAIALVGSHGAELPPGFDDDTATGGRDAAGALAEVLAEVRRLTGEVPGVLLEEKPFSVAVHVRNVARGASQNTADAVKHGPGSWPGVHVTEGKEVVELAVRVMDKGAAISALRARFACDAVVFAGDDVTDERGFAVLRDGDVGVKVGPGDSTARFRVAGPDDVLRLTRRLLQLRRPASVGGGPAGPGAVL